MAMNRIAWQKAGLKVRAMLDDSRRAHIDRLRLETLDPGIMGAVKLLRDAGIETFESCQGGAGHSYPEPTVRFHGQRGEGFRALAVAYQHRLPVYALRRTWSIEDGEPVGPYWEMTFASPVGANCLEG